MPYVSENPPQFSALCKSVWRQSRDVGQPGFSERELDSVRRLQMQGAFLVWFGGSLVK